VIFQKRFKSSLVSLVTGANLVLGTVAIVLSSMGHGRWAVACLILAMLMDAADGYLARKWNVFSDFGAELDSLADLTSFVVANAVLIFFWFFGDVSLWLQLAASIVFLLGGAFRLARFNVAPTTGGIFQGMPTTGVAILIAVIYLTHPDMSPLTGLFWQTTLGFLMVSNFRYPKLGKLAGLPKLIFPLFLLGCYFNLALTTALGCLAYIVSGPILTLKTGSD
jgi:CDP-diacylglycerol---serine O-phosphatidyltransferase